MVVGYTAKYYAVLNTFYLQFKYHNCMQKAICCKLNPLLQHCSPYCYILA